MYSSINVITVLSIIFKMSNVLINKGQFATFLFDVMFTFVVTVHKQFFSDVLVIFTGRSITHRDFY